MELTLLQANPTGRHASTRVLRGVARIEVSGMWLAESMGSPISPSVVMRAMFPQQDSIPNQPDNGAPRARPDETRAWPRYDAASTHFELGASSDYAPTAVMAKRYAPRYGVRKE
jgi:hypothetical protein